MRSEDLGAGALDQAVVGGALAHLFERGGGELLARLGAAHRGVFHQLAAAQLVELARVLGGHEHAQVLAAGVAGRLPRSHDLHRFSLPARVQPGPPGPSSCSIPAQTAAICASSPSLAPRGPARPRSTASSSAAASASTSFTTT